MKYMSKNTMYSTRIPVYNLLCIHHYGIHQLYLDTSSIRRSTLFLGKTVTSKLHKCKNPMLTIMATHTIIMYLPQSLNTWRVK